jgi:hypothetical protein
MKKGIILFILSAIIFLFSFTSTIISSENDHHFKPIKNALIEEPKELWREYVLVDDQWYVIIHYDDGTIGVFPIPGPTLD